MVAMKETAAKFRLGVERWFLVFKTSIEEAVVVVVFSGGVDRERRGVMVVRIRGRSKEVVMVLVLTFIYFVAHEGVCDGGGWNNLIRSATTTSSITHRHQNNTPRSVFVYAFRHQPNGDVFPAFLPDKAAVYGDGFRRLFWRLSVSHLFSEFCLELDVWVLVRSVAVVIVG
ncbi:hypothetical protein QVD17_09168 [Tagetes erecta]|uniref:Uncharacterized protein n=1 Tax=Tagetes erecta TaxID=13708 RepID=A0AAD8P3P3_TARER|nr:hypothetical protein QVD17_09168 [Tagetes erecta]